MSILKNEPTNTIISKNIIYSSQDDQNDFNPKVDLHIGGSLIPKVILDFGSQVNISPKYMGKTWLTTRSKIKLLSQVGRPRINQAYRPMQKC